MPSAPQGQSWFTVIQHFSRKLEQQVLEQGLCHLFMSFILALGHLWSFLIPEELVLEQEFCFV